MPILNYTTREVLFKIAYCGAAFAGKTTSLRYIHSAIDAEARGDFVTLATGADTTLFFEFTPRQAVVIDGFKTKLELRTVPGNVTSNAPRRILLRDADAIVFVIDSQWDRIAENVAAFENLQSNLSKLNALPDELPLILQYNKRDLPNAAGINYLDYVFNSGTRRADTFETIATRGENVFAALNEASRLVLESFAGNHARKSAAAQTSLGR